MINIINQTKELTFANMKARYRKTVAGFFWVVMSPIAMYSVQALVFKKFLHLDVPNYSLFLLGGLLPWIFIISSWEMATGSIAASGQVLKSFAISPFLIISSIVLDNFLNFLFAFFILLVPMVISLNELHVSFLLLPIPLLLLLLFVWITSSLFALLHVFFRDVKYLVNFSVSILFFLTPIFYPISFVPEKYHWIVEINPLYAIISPFRIILIERDMISLSVYVSKSIICLALFGFVLFFYWRKKKNEIYLAI